MDANWHIAPLSRRSAPRGSGDGRRPKQRLGSDPARRARSATLLDGLRVEESASGTAVSGPGFYVWDSDHDAAVSWAKQLARGLRVDCALRQARAVRPGRAAERAERRDSPTRHEPRPAHAAGRPSRVLLAEDDSDLRALLAQALREKGCEVRECVDGTALVSELGSYVLFGPPAGFDLVVSDIRMPGATALEILDALRGCDGVPPVILITAFPSEDTLAAARRLGVAAVLDKPFDVGDLVAKVEDLLSRCPGEL